MEDVIGKLPTEENIPELGAAMRELDAKIGLTCPDAPCETVVCVAGEGCAYEPLVCADEDHCTAPIGGPAVPSFQLTDTLRAVVVPISSAG